MKDHLDKEGEALALAVADSSQALREAWLQLRTAPSIKESVVDIAANATQKVKSKMREGAHDAFVDHAVVVIGAAFAVGILLGFHRPERGTQLRD